MKEEHYTFAHFWKCALQVNPHAYSAHYRGADHGMDANTYAEALRDECLAQKIQVAGLADHGSVTDSEIMRTVLVDAGIVVFPGFEVASTEKDRAAMPPEAQGSIDIPAIRDRVASILEGGREAFMQREEKYGFDY